MSYDQDGEWLRLVYQSVQDDFLGPVREPALY